MDAPGPIPFLAAHAARLYGGARPARPTANFASGLANTAPAQQSESASPAVKPAAARPTSNPPVANPLVAGKVAKPVDPLAPLDQKAVTPSAATAAYALYTRAADRVEVATAVAIGRTIDRMG